MVKSLQILGGLAGLFALVVGVWGIAVHDTAAASPGDITSAVLWTAIGLTALAVAVIAQGLSNRSG